MPDSFSAKDLGQLYRELSSGPDGLSNEQVLNLSAQQNKGRHKRNAFFRGLKLFLSQFTNPLVLLLVIAVLLSAALGQATDTIIIIFILLATGILSFWQEWHAGRAVEKLQQLIQLKCDVIRGGQKIQIIADQVCPGDIVILSAGDIIPADCRIIETNELHINESTITGESFPVEKCVAEIADDKALSEKNNCLWQGTNVISGSGKAIAVHTGANTILGSMAGSLLKNEESAFEKGIKHFGYFLMQITIVLSIVILGVNLYFKKPLFDSVLFALAIAVGMAPELLPAIMTFAMSAGAKRMLEKKVIVKKLSSIFNFGEVNLLCTDKTGTLTEGVIVVKDIVDIYGKPDPQTKIYACLNASLQNGFSNPIDEALKNLHVNLGTNKKLSEVPYDFIRKRLSILVDDGNKKFIISKGAVKNILEICSSTLDEQGKKIPLKGKQEYIEQTFADYSNKGLRAIGIAIKETTLSHITKEDETEALFLGFILLEDPLKEGIVETLEKLRHLHVGIKIITGDNNYVARYAAKQIGIDAPVVITGSDINQMLPEALVVNAAKADVFAEVEPHQKEIIIKALQKSNFVVAYMGDGINDVAAIHAADTGISVNDAVDVAKEAAEFVLMEKDLSVLADGIYEGRKTFANSMKYIYINTGSTFGGMLSIAVASLILPFLPLLPKQILFINFLTDFPYLTVASDNVDAQLLRYPGKWNLKLIKSFMLTFGIHSSLFDMITFYVLYKVLHFQDSLFQTGWFIESTMVQLFILFILRTRKPFWKSKPGKQLRIACVAAFIIMLIIPFSPVAAYLSFKVQGLKEAALLSIIIFGYIISADILKRIFFKYNKSLADQG
jgi:Mg2+-importing ATPase